MPVVEGVNVMDFVVMELANVIRAALHHLLQTVVDVAAAQISFVAPQLKQVAAILVVTAANNIFDQSRPLGRLFLCKDSYATMPSCPSPSSQADLSQTRFLKA